MFTVSPQNDVTRGARIDALPVTALVVLTIDLSNHPVSPLTKQRALEVREHIRHVNSVAGSF